MNKNYKKMGRKIKFEKKLEPHNFVINITNPFKFDMKALIILSRVDLNESFKEYCNLKEKIDIFKKEENSRLSSYCRYILSNHIFDIEKQKIWRPLLKEQLAQKADSMNPDDIQNLKNFIEFEEQNLLEDIPLSIEEQDKILNEVENNDNTN